MSLHALVIIRPFRNKRVLLFTISFVGPLVLHEHDLLSYVSSSLAIESQKVLLAS